MGNEFPKAEGVVIDVRSEAGSFAEADRIRNDLKKKGIVLADEKGPMGRTEGL